MNNARAGRLGRFCLYNQERTRIVRQIDTSELNRLAAMGEIGWFECKGKSFPCLQPKPMQSRTSNPLFGSSPSLLRSDVEMNAEGVCDGNRRFGLNRYGAVDESIVGNRVDQSMSKVEAWPTTYDKRNVVISAGQVHGAIVVSEIPDRILSFA